MNPNSKEPGTPNKKKGTILIILTVITGIITVIIQTLLKESGFILDAISGVLLYAPFFMLFAQCIKYYKYKGPDIPVEWYVNKKAISPDNPIKEDVQERCHVCLSNPNEDTPPIEGYTVYGKDVRIKETDSVIPDFSAHEAIDIQLSSSNAKRRKNITLSLPIIDKFKIKIFGAVSLIIASCLSIPLAKNLYIRAYVHGVIDVRTQLWDWSLEKKAERYESELFLIKMKTRENPLEYTTFDEWYIFAMSIICVVCLVFIILTIRKRKISKL